MPAAVEDDGHIAVTSSSAAVIIGQMARQPQWACTPTRHKKIGAATNFQQKPPSLALVATLSGGTLG
jgi:hypothetical protein